MNGAGPGRGRRRERDAEEGARGIACSFETSSRATCSRETSLKIGEPDGAYQRRPKVVRTCSCVLKQRGGMRRSGALTLGAVLMLGGVTGGWGDELSGSVGAGGPSSSGFSWPALPDEWNWSDLPVRLSASESVSYNSNILALPTGMSDERPASRRFYLDVVLWPVNQGQLVWPTVFLRRHVRSDTVSS